MDFSKDDITKEKIELLNPKLDSVFHSLFKVGNERITKAIIEAIIDKKIGSIELDNDRYLVNKYHEEKIRYFRFKG